jgi:hypothetical protein
MGATPSGTPPGDRRRDAEAVLRRMGYARVSPGREVREPEAAFWVQEAGVPRRTYPVFVAPEDRPPLAEHIDRWLSRTGASTGGPRRAIFVAPNDRAADEAWARLRHPAEPALDPDVSILVVPTSGGESPPHFHLRQVPASVLLRVATGVVVGLFRRAHAQEGSSEIDFEEMLDLIRGRFGIDVLRSLRVRTDEDALFLLYQLAQRDSYVPGDPGASLHQIVLRPTGPSARLPWFAA